MNIENLFNYSMIEYQIVAQVLVLGFRRHGGWICLFHHDLS